MLAFSITMESKKITQLFQTSGGIEMWNEMWMELFGVVLGAIIAIITTIYIENSRKPKLSIKISDPVNNNYSHLPNYPVKKARYLLIEVRNKPLHKFLRWMSRNAAIQCYGNVTFHYLDGQPVFQRVMPTRWSSSPEPIASKFEVDGTVFSFIDPSKFDMRSRVDIQPGESEQLGVVAKFDEDDECYGWSNENYFSDPLWRHPNWKLEPDRYLVNVTVYSAGEKKSEVFRLVNNVPRSDTRLEPKLPGDRVIELEKGQQTP